VLTAGLAPGLSAPGTMSRAPPQQLEFGGLFQSHELAMAAEYGARREAQRAKRKQAPKPVRWITASGPDLFTDLDIAALDSPLVGDVGNELNTRPGTVYADTETAEPAGEVLPWTDAAVAQLHEGLLLYSLRALRASGNGEEKREILQWMLAPEVTYAELADVSGRKRRVAVPQVLIPFSFARCARLCGWDPERLAEEVETMLSLVEMRSRKQSKKRKK
jgi:hypothetical protein